ncbi:hypothetical protein AHAS_Ahas19G0067800 [Arachis hypogaea]
MALSLVVFLMTWPSGSFHDTLHLEPWCFTSMSDALTSPPSPPCLLLDDDIFFVFFKCSLCFSFCSAGTTGDFFLF